MKSYDTRIQYFVRLSSVLLLITYICFFKLWSVEREFPVVPFFEILLGVPPFVHKLFFMGSILSLVAVLLRPQWTRMIQVYLLLAGSLCFLDAIRLQPWIYLSSLFLFFTFFSNGLRFARWGFVCVYL